MERLPRIWTSFGGNSSYKPPGASDTAPGPYILQGNEKMRERNFYNSFKTSVFLDLDFGFQTFGAGSRMEISRRIRKRGPFTLFLSSSVENLGKTKTIKFNKLYDIPLYSLFGDYTVPLKVACQLLSHNSAP